MRIIAAMLGGFILDWIFGDPAWLVHPVVIMGKAISALEAFLRKRLPNTPKGERMGGLFLAMTLPVGTLLLTGGICRVLSAVHPALGFAVERSGACRRWRRQDWRRKAQMSIVNWSRAICPQRERRSAALSGAIRKP